MEAKTGSNLTLLASTKQEELQEVTFLKQPNASPRSDPHPQRRFANGLALVKLY